MFVENTNNKKTGVLGVEKVVFFFVNMDIYKKETLRFGLQISKVKCKFKDLKAF